MPDRDYWLKYDMNTILEELRDDPEDLALLREDFPALIGLLESGDAESTSLRLSDLQSLLFRSFDPQMVQKGTRRIFALRAI